MAQAAPTLFCGRCGAPLSPGAGFCGRCGTPVLMPGVAAPPLYRYQPPPPPAGRPAGQYKLAPALIAGGLVVILIVVAAVIGAVALRQSAGGTRATCTSNCTPKIVSPLAEEASFTSSHFKFEVNYSSKWTVRSQDANGITLGTRLGYVSVTGMAAGNNDQVLDATVSALPSSQFQDVALLAALKGAHIGNQDGLGKIYSATLGGPSQTATKVRFAVIVAGSRGVTVVIFALNPADPKNSPNGMAEGQFFDYLCTEFVWG